MINQPNNSLVLSEQDTIREIGQGLENCLKDAEKIDKQIARTLTYSMGPIARLPVIRDIMIKIKGIKPLASLESTLRKSINNSLTSIVRVGKRADEEKLRIEKLEEIYGIAQKEEWEPDKFLNFIEANTDISFTIDVDGQSYDMKTLMSQVDSSLTPERRAEKQKEYMEWFGRHIDLSKQYLQSMNALCYVGCEITGGMSLSYFDLTSLRGGMEEVQKALSNLGKGTTASVTTQQALRQYGTAYVSGMRHLYQGYKKMVNMRNTGSNEFNSVIKQLESDIMNTKVQEGLKPSSDGRYVLPGRSR